MRNFNFCELSLNFESFDNAIKFGISLVSKRMDVPNVSFLLHPCNIISRTGCLMLVPVGHLLPLTMRSNGPVWQPLIYVYAISVCSGFSLGCIFKSKVAFKRNPLSGKYFCGYDRQLIGFNGVNLVIYASLLSAYRKLSLISRSAELLMLLARSDFSLMICFIDLYAMKCSVDWWYQRVCYYWLNSCLLYTSPSPRDRG